MATYYELLLLTPRASGREVEIAFRRQAARYRLATTVDHLLDDPRFVQLINAYLTLSGPLRASYDATLPKTKGAKPPPEAAAPVPLVSLSAIDRRMLVARLALWRTEHVECIGYLRALLATEPGYAPGWAMLGETLLSINHADDALPALERAVALAPTVPSYAARLQHARDVQAGVAEYEPELTPEDLYARDVRRKRLAVAAVVGLLGLAIVAHALAAPLAPLPNAMYVPWHTVGAEALGMLVCFFALGFGRLLQPFEQTMLLSSLPAGDRGRIRNYPYGLILLVMTVPSLWLAALVLLIMGAMDEEWPVSPTIMLGVCALANGLLTFLVYRLPDMHDHWSGTLLIGGNALVLAAMLGWWVGSLGADDI